MKLPITQILAGALAAVSAALAASFFGVQGTLFGAAVGSVIATVAGALYSHSLATTHGWLARWLGQRGPARSIRWRRVAGATVVVFALALSIITVIEATTKEPLARLVGARPPARAHTSIGAVLEQAPASPAHERPGGPASTTTGPSTTTAEQPASTAPSSSALGQGSASTTSPTSAPSTTQPPTTEPPTTAPATTAPPPTTEPFLQPAGQRSW